MLINMKTILSLVLGVLSSALLAAEALPVLVVQPHAVAVTFPAEGLIEAVQQSTVAAQIAGRVLDCLLYTSRCV